MYNIIVLEASITFHCNYVTVTVVTIISCQTLTLNKKKNWNKNKNKIKFIVHNSNGLSSIIDILC